MHLNRLIGRIFISLCINQNLYFFNSFFLHFGIWQGRLRKQLGRQLVDKIIAGLLCSNRNPFNCMYSKPARLFSVVEFDYWTRRFPKNVTTCANKPQFSGLSEEAAFRISPSAIQTKLLFRSKKQFVQFADINESWFCIWIAIESGAAVVAMASVDNWRMFLLINSLWNFVRPFIEACVHRDRRG